MSEFDDIRARLKAATAGPWRKLEGVIIQTNHVTRDVWVIPKTEADLDFIAHAPEDIARLLAALDAIAAEALRDPDAPCESLLIIHALATGAKGAA